MDILTGLEGSQDQAPVSQDANPKTNHYENLLENLDDMTIKSKVAEIIRKVDDDIEAHVEYVDLCSITIKNLGLNRKRRVSDDANVGVSSLADPAAMKAGNDISARIMAQFYGTDKPVKTLIMGKSTPLKMSKADRVRDYMSWQVLSGIKGYFQQDDFMFQMTAHIGTGFKKLFWDGKKTVSEYISPVDLIVPYEAQSLLRAERITHRIKMSKYEFKKLVRNGFYRDEKTTPVNQEPNKFDTEMDLVVQRMKPPEPDGYTVLEVHCLLELDELYPDMGELPYILSYDANSQRLLRLARNWDIEDPTMTRCEVFFNYVLFPWKGVYGYGLSQLVGLLSDTASDIRNDLIDAGFRQQMLTGLKAHTDMSATRGDAITLREGSFQDIKLDPGQRLADSIMLVPMNPPSPVLLELLKMIGDEIGQMATINSQNIADASNIGPVGTTYALIAENAKIFNAIFKRQHMAKAEEFMALKQLNYRHLDNATTVKIFGGELVVSREDFNEDVSVIPVSDPNCSTIAEKIGRLQVIGDMAKLAPNIINPQALVKMTFDTIGVPDLDTLMNPIPPQPIPRDPYANVQAIISGIPVNAFPQQMPDSDYHLTFYTWILNDPSFGMNRYLVETGFTYKLIQLMMEFQVLRTQNMLNTAATGQKDSQKPMVGLNAPPMPPEAEQAIIAKMCNPEVLAQITESNKMVFDHIRPSIEDSLRFAPPKPQDPEMVAAESMRTRSETQARAEAARNALEAAKIEERERINVNSQNQATLRALISAIKTLPQGFELQQLFDIFKHLPVNDADNFSDLALAIHQMTQKTRDIPRPPTPSFNQAAMGTQSAGGMPPGIAPQETGPMDPSPLAGVMGPQNNK